MGSSQETSSAVAQKADQGSPGTAIDADQKVFEGMADKDAGVSISTNETKSPSSKELPVPSTFRGGNLREDDVRAHPDLYPFLSRRPAHSTAPLPELLHEYAYFAQGELEDELLVDEDEEDVEQLAESERQAIEQEFGPEEALFDDDLPGDEADDAQRHQSGQNDGVQQVEMAGGMTEEEMREERSRMMAEEYERNCGGLWTDYRACLQVSFLEPRVTVKI